MSYYPASGSTITPPPTPSRAAINPISQQSTAPYHQQQPLSTTSPVYPSLFFPRPANVRINISLDFKSNRYNH